MIKIVLASLFVDNQDKAIKFYTDVLGFLKKTEFPAGKYKWLTVVSQNNPNGVELTLEPNDNPIAHSYQKGLHDAGIPATAFGVDDIQKEFERMKNLGVEFKTPPTKTGPVTIAVFNDTCGNWIQLVQK